ncbi:hypothetical protein PAE9249_05333 [Paenibacillus sp. CECT 9249]|uniref:BlaI/MecI/CopY family transcriptional regulator n=1 Tax=Paenibacillus sp. CECT 9249 TaxID=2845385 RepID=UPI001E2BD56B|nr:BlaI/MecI/CopY family transcriptional regulator [Paenibacillus sp. CECT 9249]CAH0122742.1 hypothetical protein PAE9249_05333 [Paenibacillus sp. CECT 9249]
MDFEQAHKEFLERHVSLRQGERKGRLLRGHQYAEKLFLQNVWWPLFGNFDRLHPEYEIYDWNRKSQFLDFAFIAPFGRFGLECDGFQSHVKDMDRERFSYALNRDTFLTGMGWKMLHFSFDNVQSRPEICRTLLQLAVAPYLIRNKAVSPPVLIEKEVLRLAWGLGRWIRPKDVCDHLEVDFRTARKWLRSLVEKGWLQPIARGRDIRYYELNATALKQLW